MADGQLNERDDVSWQPLGQANCPYDVDWRFLAVLQETWRFAFARGA